MNASFGSLSQPSSSASDQQQQQHSRSQAPSLSDPRLSTLTSAFNDPPTLVLLTDPSTPPTQSAAAAGASLTPHNSSSTSIATAAARSTPTFSGSGFAEAQDPSKHLAQLPLETPFFTPQAPWTESSRSDYFSGAASTPAPPRGHPSQANLFASTFAVPAQTPAAVEITSFAASSPSYFPSSLSTEHEPQGFHLPPTTPFQGSMPPVTHFRPGSSTTSAPWEPYPSGRSNSSSAADPNGSSASIPALRTTNLSISMPLSSLMSPPGSRLSMSSLSPRHPSPSASVPPGQSLKEMDASAVSRLLEQVLMANDDTGKAALMLLDMRPSPEHMASSIKTAVNVCVPSVLLKRASTSLQKVMDHLTTEQDSEIFSKWRQFANIVLFDASGSAPIAGSPSLLLAQKFRMEGCTANLAYLRGGFSEFYAQHNNLCSSEGNGGSGDASTQAMAVDSHGGGSVLSSSAPMSSAPRPMSMAIPVRQRLHLGSLPSMMTQPPAIGCQTPMIENPNVNPLFESVRQAMGLSTNITEEIPVRLPKGWTVDTMRNQLPSWLQSAITEKTGEVRLSEYFQKVEINENRRLALLMLPQNMRSGRTTHFSIGAGIEQGLKNRYNNIWPYDHTRVKIAEVSPDQDDYINASMLTPPVSRKSYIATQGPLPSTFQDFWKAAWEQNARVVVMLTKEQELGRIKCHQYWPTSEQPIMDAGVMKVTFVTEFLPDPQVGTILVRHLTLQHARQPEAGERQVTQIQYTGWPDFGVPDTPLEVLRVIQLANDHNAPMAGPMIVHCSAGCGRTGAFCVIDSILTELRESPETVLQQPSMTGQDRPLLSALSTKPSLEFFASGNERVANAMAASSSGSRPSGSGSGSAGLVGLSSSSTSSLASASASSEDPMADVVFASVSVLREQRISMVQTLRQYVFCYEAIFWHLARQFAEERPELGLRVEPAAPLSVHTPLLPLPPNANLSNAGLSRGNAPITTTSKEFSFFG
ncbi:hypothetical protein BGZ70_001046 [Mortierella alpina]|uniref:protein-tyrosine-phosphatase n=1 Tax=Mortierella alpina TaxID=64518 RepID=A0A9P6IX31_MORAP|nr:hypothetical protein BGZ70_001046 [Mortierella alpina]